MMRVSVITIFLLASVVMTQGQQTVTVCLDTDKSDIVEAVLTLGVKNPASIQNPPYPISLFRQH